MTSTSVLLTSNAEETEKVGRHLGNWVKAGDVLALYGELGTGKTVLVRGLAWALGVKERVGSPSFTIVCEYEGRLPLFHIDLFRVLSVEEVLKIGYEDYLYGTGVCAIEWAEKMESLLPQRRTDIRLYHEGENQRRIEVIPRQMESPSLPASLLRNARG